MQRLLIVVAALAATTAVVMAPLVGAQAARERPSGVIANYPRMSGAVRLFDLPWNLVIEPLLIERGNVPMGYSEALKGDKLFVYVRAGHRVTLELPGRVGRGAGLEFFPLPTKKVGAFRAHRAVTFIADRSHLTAWIGGIVAHSPRCIPLLIWIDDRPSPRRATIRLGVDACE